MKIEAHQCVVCKSLYFTSEEADVCQKACNDVQRQQEEKDQLDANMSEIVNSVRLNTTSIADLEQRILEVSKQIHGKNAIQSIKFSVRLNDYCSASHNAPIGKPTSWGNSTNPKNYPGFSGSLSYSYSDVRKGDRFDNHFSRSNKKGIPAIHTGTGGARREGDMYKGSYDVTIFLDDFPMLAKSIDDERRKSILAKENAENMRQTYFSAVKEDDIIKEAVAKKIELQEKIRALNDLVAKENSVIAKREAEICEPFNEQVTKFNESLEATHEYAGRGVASLPKTIFG